MKKYILFIILLLLISGCKSSKPLVSSETKSASEVSENKNIMYDQKQKLLEHFDKLEKKLINEDVTVTTFTTEYDTNQPVDPGTGKPPIKSETKTDITKNKHGETISTDNSMKSKENTSNLTDNSVIATKNNQVEKVKQESPKDPYRYRYIFYAIAVVAIILIFFNWSKIFAFVKKILKL